MHFVPAATTLIKNCNSNFVEWDFFHFRDHPFKRPAFSKGEGVSPLPTFANSKGVGVLGMKATFAFEIL